MPSQRNNPSGSESPRQGGNDSFAYDPAGRREWKLIGPDNFINTGSDNDEYYLYDVAGHRVGRISSRRHSTRRKGRSRRSSGTTGSGAG